MQYYAIINNEIAIGNKASMDKFYQNINELPADYYERSYIVRNGELVADGSAEKTKMIEELDAQYNSDKAILMSQYTEADMIEDFEMKAQIKVELATLQAEYDRAYEEIVGGEE